jgi:hypothetical protein
LAEDAESVIRGSQGCMPHYHHTNRSTCCTQSTVGPACPPCTTSPRTRGEQRRPRTALPVLSIHATVLRASTAPVPHSRGVRLNRLWVTNSHTTAMAAGMTGFSSKQATWPLLVTDNDLQTLVHVRATPLNNMLTTDPTDGATDGAVLWVHCTRTFFVQCAHAEESHMHIHAAPTCGRRMSMHCRVCRHGWL